jgi:hypothetical protein
MRVEGRKIRVVKAGKYNRAKRLISGCWFMVAGRFLFFNFFFLHLSLKPAYYPSGNRIVLNLIFIKTGNVILTKRAIVINLFYHVF